MIDAAWHIVEHNQPVGPLSFDELRNRLRRPNHGPDSPVWTDGMSDWAAARDVPQLADIFQQPHASAAGNPAAAPPPHNTPRDYAAETAVQGPQHAQAGDDVSTLLAVGCHVANLFTFPVSLFAIAPLVMNRDTLSRYHAGQALGTFIIYAIATIVCLVLTFVCIGWLLLPAVVILYYIDVIVGIVYAAQKRHQTTPIVGSLASSMFNPSR
jgi:uncharacterized membrane protein